MYKRYLTFGKYMNTTTLSGCETLKAIAAVLMRVISTP